MKKRVKLMLAALLGFSAACATVKNTPQDEAVASADQPEKRTEGQLKIDSTYVPQRIRLMYGVPSPRPTVQPTDSVNLQRDSVSGEQITVLPLENPTEK